MIAVLLPLLAACGNTGGPDLASTVVWPFQSNPDATAEEEEAPAEPQLELTLGRRRANAVLIQHQGESRMWRTPGDVVVATERGRVVGTAGLAQMVMATRFDGPDPLDDPEPLLRRSAGARRLVDLSGRNREPSGMRFGVVFECRLRAFETEEENVLLVEERCRVPRLSPVLNRFWVDAQSRRVLAAEQWIGPGLPPLVLDFPE
jgi:hypothetical protein